MVFEILAGIMLGVGICFFMEKARKKREREREMLIRQFRIICSQEDGKEYLSRGEHG